MQIYELSARFDARASFYGKAGGIHGTQARKNENY